MTRNTLESKQGFNCHLMFLMQLTATVALLSTIRSLHSFIHLPDAELFREIESLLQFRVYFSNAQLMDVLHYNCCK